MKLCLSRTLATWFGLGLIPKAPGTWGSLGALPFGVVFYAYGGVTALGAAVIIVTVGGWWAAGQYEKATGNHDNPQIVIDEVAGMWLTLLGAGTSPVLIFAAFLLFRLFDILKPWPVSWCDKTLPGAAGVMADDIAAGLYALIVLTGLKYAGLG